MKLTFKQLQPYRIWYEYLCVCLEHKELRKKIDRQFYKSWDLSQLKSGKFDKWFKTHSHLFVEKKKEITLYNCKILHGKKKINGYVDFNSGLVYDTEYNNIPIGILEKNERNVFKTIPSKQENEFIFIMK